MIFSATLKFMHSAGPDRQPDPPRGDGGRDKRSGCHHKISPLSALSHRKIFHQGAFCRPVFTEHAWISRAGNSCQLVSAPYTGELLLKYTNQ